MSDKRLGIVSIKKALVKVKRKDGVSYSPSYRINLPKEFMESHGLKEGDLVCVLPLKQIENKSDGGDENNKSLKILGRELTPMETRIYLALLKLGKARWEDVQKEIGGGSGGHLRRLLVKMTREGLLSREKRYHQGERGGPYYVYQAVIPQEISGSISNHDKEVREDPNTKGNAESQTNAIRGKIVKEVVAKRWIQEKQGKIYEYGGIAVLLPREYANKKLLIVLPESKNLNRD